MKILKIITLLTLTGCATNSGILPLSDGIYMVSREAATGLHGTNQLKIDALKEAKVFCESKGLQLNIIDIKEERGWVEYPKADIKFKCVEK